MLELTAGEDAERQQYGRNKADSGGWVKQTDNCSEEDKWEGREEEEESMEESERSRYNAPLQCGGEPGGCSSAAAHLWLCMWEPGCQAPGPATLAGWALAQKILVINEAGATLCTEEVDEEWSILMSYPASLY